MLLLLLLGSHDDERVYCKRRARRGSNGKFCDLMYKVKFSPVIGCKSLITLEI